MSWVLASPLMRGGLVKKRSVVGGFVIGAIG